VSLYPNEQEAQLSQRNCATLLISWDLVNFSAQLYEKSHLKMLSIAYSVAR